jgi:hypothetical protein
MDGALTKKGCHPLTATIGAQKAHRSNVFNGLAGLIDILVSDKDNPGQAAKASRLRTIISQHDRSVCRSTQVRGTTAIRVVLEEFDKPANAAIVDELGLRDRVELLRAAQNGFEAAFDEKVTAKSAMPRIKPLCEVIGYDLYGLLTYIEHEADKDPQRFETLVNELNGQITAIMTIARARRSRRENGGAPAPAVTAKEGSTA